DLAKLMANDEVPEVRETVLDAPRAA
ncbi:chemotaxis protein CheW, partial [Herbaspirillum sp. HC18]